MTSWWSNSLVLVLFVLCHSLMVSGWLTRPKQAPIVQTMNCITASAAFGKRIIPLCTNQGPQKRSGQYGGRSAILDALASSLRQPHQFANLDSSSNALDFLNDRNQLESSQNEDDPFWDYIKRRSEKREKRFEKFRDFFADTELGNQLENDVIPAHSEIYDAKRLLKLLRSRPSRDEQHINNKRFFI